MELGNPEASRMSFAEHYHELACRVVRVTGSVLIAFGITSYFPNQCDSAFSAITGRLAGTTPIPSQIVFDRWIWAAAVSFLIGFCQLIRHLSAYVGPGLYAEELYQLRVTRRWLYSAPVIALLMPGIALRAACFSSSILTVVSIFDPKLLVIRVLISSLVTASFLNLPRKRVALGPVFFVGALSIVWAVPDHVYLTALATGVELAAVLFLLSVITTSNLFGRLYAPETTSKESLG
jgi:hypothetical protein